MSQITNVKLPDNNVYNLRASALRYVEGTGTAAKTSSPYRSAKWEADIDDISEYYDGLTIVYKVPVAGNGSYGTVLQINSLGYHPVLRAVNSMVSTRYAVGATVALVYNSSVSGAFYNNSASSTTVQGAWMVINDIDNDTTAGRGYNDYYFRAYAGSALYRYKLCMLGENNRMYPIVTTDQSSSTQVTKAVQTAHLKPHKIWLYNATATVSAGSVIGAQTLYPAMYLAGSGYSFNANVPTYRMIYLCGSYNKATDLFKLDNSTTSSYFVYVPTSSSSINLASYFSSGKYYILVGASYSTANYFSLFDNNPMYYFDGTNLIPVSTKIANDVAADIPTKTSDLTNDSNFVVDASYVHTDNNYTTTEKNKLSGIAAGAQVNQNAFSNVKVGSIVVPALGTTDTLEIDASGGISITADISEKKITFTGSGSPSTQVQSNWNETDTTSAAYIQNKPTNVSAFTNDAGYLTSYTETDPTVPSWAKASTKPSYTASEVGAVPTTRTVNGKALSADISLTASDVNALPSSTTIPSKTSDLTNDSGFITSADIPIELYPVHVSLSGMSSGTADHTSLEILAAVGAGKLPVVGVAMGDTVMMATLVHVGPDLDGQYTEAIFVYENQNAWFYNYITLSINESGAVTLVPRDAYATLDDIPQNVSDLTNDSDFIPRTEFRLTKSENQGIVTYTVNARPVDIGDAANHSYPVFTELVNNSKTQYWTLWFVNISSNKFGLYRYENDDKSIRYVVFEYGGYGNATTGTEGAIDLDAPMSHPVGTVIITDSNTNPSTTYGGTWSLIDKEFTTTTAQQITCGTASSSDCVINSTNTTSMSAWVSRQGHSIFLSINAITFKVSVSGTNLTLGTFDLAKLGANEAAISPVIMGWSDGAHAIVGMNINRTSGVLQSQDVVVRGNGTSIAAGSSAVFTVELPCDYTEMIDSFCNKFYWRRTA